MERGLKSSPTRRRHLIVCNLKKSRKMLIGSRASDPQCRGLGLVVHPTGSFGAFAYQAIYAENSQLNPATAIAHFDSGRRNKASGRGPSTERPLTIHSIRATTCGRTMQKARVVFNDHSELLLEPDTFIILSLAHNRNRMRTKVEVIRAMW